MKTAQRTLLAALLVTAALAAGGCGTKQAVSTVIQQGVETTSTGPHNTVPANNAQNAVGDINNSINQTQQGAAGAGQ